MMSDKRERNPRTKNVADSDYIHLFSDVQPEKGGRKKKPIDKVVEKCFKS